MSVRDDQHRSVGGLFLLNGLVARHPWLRRRERALGAVPRPILLLGILAFLAQIAWHTSQPRVQAEAVDLPAPQSISIWRAASFGDPIALSKTLMLWLQAFDNQPGISIPFRRLDYVRVEQWLDAALALDPRGQYPLLAAARLYAEVSDETRQRRMLDFIHRKFLEDPDRRWPWMAHAALIAKHRLKDLPLALKFGQVLADKSSISAVPPWARQMHIFLLEDMGELESARVLIGGLLESGVITDEHEMHFLTERLKSLQ